MTWLITAGSAYFHSSAPMSRVSSSLVLSVVSNTVLYYIKVHKNKPRRYTFFWFMVYYSLRFKVYSLRIDPQPPTLKP